MVVALISFTLTAIVLVLLPGPDTLVVLRSLVRGGRAAGTRTAAGVLCGLLVWVVAAALGLSALLQASRIGYDLLKIVGAGYLIWIGVQSLRALRRTSAEESAAYQAASPLDRLGSFGAGLLTDILNPKIGVLFVSFLPGFVPEGSPIVWTTLGFGAIFVLLTALYFTTLVAASGAIENWLRAPAIRRRVDALTGVVLVGFGVRLATES